MGRLHRPRGHGCRSPPQVKATPIPGKKADHLGIRVQLIGQIELAAERGHPTDFLSLGARPAGGALPAGPGKVASTGIRPSDFLAI